VNRDFLEGRKWGGADDEGVQNKWLGAKSEDFENGFFTHEVQEARSQNEKPAPLDAPWRRVVGQFEIPAVFPNGPADPAVPGAQVTVFRRMRQLDVSGT